MKATASKRRHYSRNKIAKMKEIAETKIKEYLHDIEVADRLEETEIIFGSHQGTDVGYNIQSVVDCKNKLIITIDVSNFSAD